MRNPSILITVLFAFFVAPVFAQSAFAKEPAVGAHFRSQPGQPICFERDDLQEYMQALLKRDQKWAKSLTGCGGMSEGIDYVVTELGDGEPNPVMTLAKIRVLDKSGSLVGWTIIVSGN